MRFVARYIVPFSAATIGIAIVACGAFGTSPESTTTDAGTDATSSVDASTTDAPVDASFGCKPGTTILRDDFNRDSPLARDWSEPASIAPGAQLALSGGALVAKAPGAATDQETRLVENALGTFKSACVSMRIRIVEPTSYGGYDGGRTDLMFLSVSASNTSVIHFYGLTIGSGGPYVYWSTIGGSTGESDDVTFASAGDRFMVEVDFANHSSKFTVGGTSKPFSKSFSVGDEMPTGLSLQIGVDQFRIAPGVEVVFDDVELVGYP